MNNPPRILIISHDIVGPTMAGPGIRYYHLTRVLAAHLPVTLAIPGEETTGGDYPFAVAGYRRRTWATLAPHVAAADVCLFPSDVADEMPALGESGKRLVVDGYDPLMAEWLALSVHAAPEARRRAWGQRMTALARQVLIGDFYLCASERQRDWWLGLLEAGGRLNPANFDADPSLRKLVDVVPYGLPSTPLPPPRPVLKGVWPGLGEGDRLLLWGGGLWPWLDPLTAIRAVGRIHATRPEVKLLFPGTRHPNPAMAGMPNRTEEAQALAQELGLVDRAVFFGDWLPYADWPHVLQECDVALSLHYDTVETRLAFRSRVLETIWAGLPTVASGGDATGDLLARYGLGLLVPDQDPDAVADAIVRLLDEPRQARAAAFAAARQALSWEKAAAPLVAYCRNPQLAADKAVAGAEPYFDPYRQLRDERDEWRARAEAYANGRVMQTFEWIARTKRRVMGG